MAIRSYDIIYLDDVATNIGTMFEYAIENGLDASKYWNMFVSSNVAKEIELGNPTYLSGYSAIDLFERSLSENLFEDILLETRTFFTRSKYYWAGFVLAQYQNYKCISFYNINKLLPIEKVLALYDTLHEADITKFFIVADEYINNCNNETNLKKIRISAGFSQKQLSINADVSIRNIQMYEQRQNNINKAQADILFRLSKALGCRIEDLLEV